MPKFTKKPFDLNDPHTLTGQIALWLILSHAVWATQVVKKGTEMELINFNR